jgi:hypothetical protein
VSVRSQDGNYTTGDDDLDLLLSLTDDMSSGKAGHDGAVWWLSTLEKVKTRLQQPAAPDYIDCRFPECSCEGVAVCFRESLARKEQPTIRQQQSIDDLPGMWDKSDLEGGEADSHADLIRMRLLQHVPPVGEWPEGATHWAFDPEGDSNYFKREPYARSMWIAPIAERCHAVIPKSFWIRWQQSLWSREEVLAARVNHA